MRQIGVTFIALAFLLYDRAESADVLPRAGAPSQNTAAAPEKPSANPNQFDSNQAQKAPAAREPQVHYLRQTTCNIPFTIDASRPPPIELQLFVSADRGGSWKLYAKAAPGDGAFAFRAIQDGEYWFALRTIERAKTPPDPKSLTPGLKIVFDTRQPDFQFDAEISSSGEIRGTWKASDSHIAARSLRIEYRTDAQAPWQLVRLEQADSGTQSSLAGTQTWHPDVISESILVRAEVQDLAGNNTIITRQLRIQDTGVRHEVVSTRQARTSRSSEGNADGSVSWPINNVLPTRPTKPPVVTHSELPPPKPSAEEHPVAIRTESSAPRVAPASQSNGSSYPSFDQRDFPAGDAAAAPADQPAGEAIATPAETPSNGASDDDAPERSPFEERSIDAPTTGNDAQNFSPQTTRPAPNEGAVPLPAGEQPRMTKVRRFSLDYEVDPLGNASVAKVELWGTSDGGETWVRWLDDEDRVSPVEVDVQKDGIFGFRIVIVANNQLASPPPQRGDPADIWVGVDATKPVVQITSATYGEGEHVGQLNIRWDAQDARFAPNPITLAFSEQPQGPWITIAAGLPNTGQYYWAVEPRIPREIYLRIEARDEAGNVGEYQVAEPLSTAGLIPHGRIRGLRIPGEKERSASRWPTARP